jgi:hypothetical protein
VVVSDISSVPCGSILSSPVSLEPQYLHEGNRSKHGNSTLDSNPGVFNIKFSGATVLCNPTYGISGHSIISSGEDVREIPSGDNNRKSAASDEVPIEQLFARTNEDKESAHKLKKNVATTDYALVIKNQNMVSTEGRNEQAEL